MVGYVQDINMKFNKIEDVVKYSEENDKTLVIMNDYVLDATTFMEHHPGGSVLIRNYKNKSVDEEMKSHYPLSLVMANTLIIGSFQKDISRMIDPNMPLLPQIWHLDEQSYMKVINSPHWLFVPSPRMFQSNFVEFFSHNKWYSIILLPTFIILYNLLKIQNWSTFNPAMSLLAAITGFLFFTLTQYCLHRFIFHSESYLPNSKLVRYLHYILHGIHHMLPNDPDRLVYPPVLAIATFFLGLNTVAKVINIQDPILSAVFWSFFLIGYMTYDISHWAMHHIDTSNSKGGYFHRLQRYHNQHHFGGEQAGFGVSSPLWDIILNTGFTTNKKH